MMEVCLLGASGSIGKQTIDVMLKNPLDFDLVAFSVGHQVKQISKILKKYPNIQHICVADEFDCANFQRRHPKLHFYWGDAGLNELILNSNPDMVVNALVGFVGLVPSIVSLENKGFK